MVYGHVIASDVFGDAYVVPLGATFQDIKQKLNASFVSLPNTTEVRLWMEKKFKVPVDHSRQKKCTAPGIDSGYSTALTSPIPSV